MTPTLETEPEIVQEFRNIPIDLIRDPQAPARESLDKEKYLELCQSITDVGLIEPVVVKDCNDHFEVVAGHRRTMACRAAGLKVVPCMIRRDSKVSDLSIMIHENAFREDMNPVEEARFYLRALREEADNDIDKLCSMLRRERNFVEGRILLLAGYPSVVDALEKGHITIAVSKLLHKVTDPNRLLILLDLCMQGGANARQVAEWVRDANGQEPIQLPPADPEGDAARAAAAGGSAGMVCIFCGSMKHAHTMRMVWAHEICHDNFVDAQTHLNQTNLV